MLIKNICCIGAGYVGGPTMAMIALKCPDIKVTVADHNSERIDAWNGSLENLPIYEPGLSDIVEEVRGKNLFFSNDVETSIDLAEMIFMAVNTPTKTEGEGAGMAADLSYIEACAKTIAKASKTNKIIVEKSTVPIRTAEKIKEILNREAKEVHFEILSNPEFLAEGTAVKDLYEPDRVLIGGDDTESGQKAVAALEEMYSNWISKDKILTTNVWSSELAKLASNAMLAQRISSINSLSALCEKTEANIDELSKAIGMDHRIGKYFLKVSPGFGGSCFQKDILNLVYLCNYYGLNEVAEFWHQVVKINDYQRDRLSTLIINEEYNKPNVVTILGWAFKSDTNDSRESSSIYITKKLIESGIIVNIYDPSVKKEKIFSDLDHVLEENINYDRIYIFNNIHNSIENANSIAILTEWNQFIEFDWKGFVNSKKGKIKIYDFRNIIGDQLNNYQFYFKI